VSILIFKKNNICESMLGALCLGRILAGIDLFARQGFDGVDWNVVYIKVVFNLLCTKFCV
jgi:hypothetical protein